MLIISILNNFVKEKDPGGLIPAVRPPSPLPLGKRDSLPAGRQGEGYIGKMLNA